MTKRINWLTTRVVDSKPSLRPPSPKELEKRAQLRAQIDAMHLDETTTLTDGEILALRRHIQGHGRWIQHGGAKSMIGSLARRR